MSKLSCVYTTQKTKKLKKWLDGFLEKSSNSLSLYSEEGQRLSTGKFKELEDGTFELSCYLIYLDECSVDADINVALCASQSLLNNSQSSGSVNEFIELQITEESQLKRAGRSSDDVLKRAGRSSDDVLKRAGRSSDDVLRLLL